MALPNRPDARLVGRESSDGNDSGRISGMVGAFAPLSSGRLPSSEAPGGHGFFVYGEAYRSDIGRSVARHGKGKSEERQAD